MSFLISYMLELANSVLLVYLFGCVIRLQNLNTADSWVADRYPLYLDSPSCWFMFPVKISCEGSKGKSAIILLDSHTIK